MTDPIPDYLIWESLKQRRLEVCATLDEVSNRPQQHPPHVYYTLGLDDDAAAKVRRAARAHGRLMVIRKVDAHPEGSEEVVYIDADGEHVISQISGGISFSDI